MPMTRYLTLLALVILAAAATVAIATTVGPLTGAASAGGLILLALAARAALGLRR